MSLTADELKIIHATVPILEQGGDTLTKHFYDRMFTENPEVLQFFNKAHQQSMAQPKALARSLLLYAKNIENLELLDDLVERIVQKHCAIMVQPEHYPIVGTNLLAAMVEVLGKDTATPAVLGAWEKAYNAFANVLIEAEGIVYEANEQAHGGWRGWRKFRVAAKEPETSTVTSFYLRAVDDKPIITPEPGQFLGFQFPMESGDTYRRQYSLSANVKDDDNKPMYRISVKRLPGGIVSKHWHDRVRVGDEVDVCPPCGDMILDEKHAKDDLLLIGAGIGITPLVSIAEKALQQGRDVTFVQCDRDLKSRPFHRWFLKMAETYPSFHFKGFFSCECPEEKQVADDGHYHKHYDMPEGGQHGRMAKEDLKAIVDAKKGKGTDIYIVGPHQFMHEHRKYLDEFDNKEHRVYYEYFGPTIE